MHRPVDTKPLPKAKVEAAREQFRSLCKSFVEQRADSSYADYIGSAATNEAVLDRQVRAFELYAPYLSDGMSILDWGCRHAPDSCMLRTLLPGLSLSGCDTMDEDFSLFHRFAGLGFKVLNHEYQLPYESESFDAVISGGVLEHVAFERESILEIWRVLKDDGLFIVTFLPNARSYTERLGRVAGSYRGHNRLYNFTDTKNMFLRTGFVIERAGYHQIFPTLGKKANVNRVVQGVTSTSTAMNRPLENVPLVRSLASNLYFILRKVKYM